MRATAPNTQEPATNAPSPMTIPPRTVQPVTANIRGAMCSRPRSWASTIPVATSSDASANASRRVARRLVTTSSTPATRQVPPRWIAKPIRVAQIAATASPSMALLRGFAGDGRGDFARHLQLRIFAGDAVALTDEREIRVGDLGRAVGSLTHQHAHRPVEARIRIGLDELDTERRVAEQHQRRLADRQVRRLAKLLLVDRGEVADALGFDRLLDASDGLVDRMAAGEAKHAIRQGGGGRSRGSRGRTGGRGTGEQHCDAEKAADRVRRRGADHGAGLLLTCPPQCRPRPSRRNWKLLSHRCSRSIDASPLAASA